MVPAREHASQASSASLQGGAVTHLQLESSLHGCMENDSSIEEAEAAARVHKRGCCRHHAITLVRVERGSSEPGEVVRRW